MRVRLRGVRLCLRWGRKIGSGSFRVLLLVLGLMEFGSFDK